MKKLIITIVTMTLAASLFAERINLNPNVTNPLPSELSLLSEKEAKQQLYDLDPNLDINKYASEQFSWFAAGRKYLKDQKAIEDVAKESKHWGK